MSHGIDRKMSPGAAADSEEFPTRRSFLNVSEILRSFAFKERTLAFQEQPLAFSKSERWRSKNNCWRSKNNRFAPSE